MHHLRIGRDWLATAAMALLGANLLHGADHVRQHLDSVNTVVRVGGGMLAAAAVAVVIVVLRRHPRAPLLATLVGFAAAILVSASHVAPHWSVLSDSYIDDVHPDVLSWAVMLLEVAAGFLLGVVGAHTLRAQARGADDGRALTEGLERATSRRGSTAYGEAP
jgi:drug/metabolite transporter (DMT)-like permease